MYRSSGRECFFYILRKWKALLGAGLAAAVLLGGYTGAKAVLNLDRNTANIKEAWTAYNEMTEYLHGVTTFYDNQISDKQRALEDYRRYLENDPALSYDASQIGTAYADILIDSFTPDGTAREISDDYLNVFETILNENIDWALVASRGNVDEIYVRDLVTTSYWGSSNRMMRVTFYSDNETKAVAMLENYLAQAEEVHDVLERHLGTFEMGSVNIIHTTGDDQNFTNLQQELINSTAQYENDIAELEQVKSELPYPALPPEIPTMTKIAVSSVKHAVLGFACGAAAMIALAYVLFFVNGKLHSTEEAEFYTCAAAFPYEPSSKKPHKGLAKLIARYDTKKLLYSEEEAVHRAILNAKMTCPDAKKIMFAGLDCDSEIASLKDTLEKEKSDLKFGLEKNILTDRSTLDHLDSYDAVILVEKLDKADVRLLKKETDLIKGSGKPIASVMLIR